MTHFTPWLESWFQKFSVDDEDVMEYVNSILTDEELDVDEKVEAVVGFVDASVEEEFEDYSNFEDELRDMLEKESKQQNEKELSKIIKSITFEEHLKIQEAKLREEERKVIVTEELSREEKQKREDFLSKYGYESNTTVDENGDIIFLDDTEEDVESIDMEKNDNKEVVASMARQQREIASKKYTEKVERDKNALEKQQKSKEKRKNKTQKREKRRGAG